MSLRFNQAGDTIVEVLIVIIVVSVVLSSGYGVAVNSLQSIQVVQERGYALKLAEGQLERLKAAAAASPAILAKGTVAGFCLDDTLKDFSTSASPTDTADGENYANYPNECRKDPNGGACTGFCYHFGVRQVSTNAYLSTVRWDGPKGTKQQVQLSYKVYE